MENESFIVVIVALILLQTALTGYMVTNLYDRANEVARICLP